MRAGNATADLSIADAGAGLVGGFSVLLPGRFLGGSMLGQDRRFRICPREEETLGAPSRMNG
jgi:hypothetical protein